MKTPYGDKPMMVAALSALASNYTPQIEQILRTALISPEQLRSAAQADVTAEQLQEACVRTLMPLASPALRLQVAEHVAKADTPSSHRRQLLPLVEVADVRYLPAQTVVYASDYVDDQTRVRLEALFARYGRELTSTLLSLGTATAAQPGAELARAEQIAGALWQREFLEAVEQRSAKVENPSQQRDFMLLAQSLPVHAARSSVYSLYDRRWAEGIDVLGTKTFKIDDFQDPGLLPIVKMLALRTYQPPQLAEGPDAYQRSIEKKKAAKELATQKFWVAARDALVRKLCDRFAGLASPPGPEGVKVGEGSLPFPLHGRGEVRAQYHATWPEDLSRKLPNASISPLEIHYVSIMLKEDPRKVVHHYERKLHPHWRRKIAKGGLWLDALHRDREHGAPRVRSIDVLIAPTPRDPAEYMLELLWIEIPDPVAAPLEPNQTVTQSANSAKG